MAKLSLFERRRRRVRSALRARTAGKPRLSVHRSGRHIYAQVIDDTAGVTLAAASTLDKEIKGKAGATKDGAAAVGKTLAERAKKAGVSSVVFDRGGFLFHGRVKALGDAAREGGLGFEMADGNKNNDDKEATAAAPPAERTARRGRGPVAPRRGARAVRAAAVGAAAATSAAAATAGGATIAAA